MKMKIVVPLVVISLILVGLIVVSLRVWWKKKLMEFESLMP